MALCIVAVGLRGGWQVCRGPGAAVPGVSGLVNGLGRLLALVESAIAGGADLDSTRPMLGMSTEPCCVA